MLTIGIIITVRVLPYDTLGSLLPHRYGWGIDYYTYGEDTIPDAVVTLLAWGAMALAFLTLVMCGITMTQDTPSNRKLAAFASIGTGLALLLHTMTIWWNNGHAVPGLPISYYFWTILPVGLLGAGALGALTPMGTPKGRSAPPASTGLLPANVAPSRGVVAAPRPPGTYLGQPGSPPVPLATNGMAVASLVLGIVGLLLCGIGSVLAIIFGHVARGQIRRSGGYQSGSGMALAGLILGYISVALIAAYVIFIISVANSTKY